MPIEETTQEEIETVPMRRVSDPVNHKYWEKVFSKAIRMDRLQFADDGRTNASMNIALDEQHNKVVRKRHFRIDVEFQNEEQSSFTIDEILED